jgi:hypothetical protein
MEHVCINKKKRQSIESVDELMKIPDKYIDEIQLYFPVGSVIETNDGNYIVNNVENDKILWNLIEEYDDKINQLNWMIIGMNDKEQIKQLNTDISYFDKLINEIEYMRYYNQPNIFSIKQNKKTNQSL